MFQISSILVAMLFPGSSPMAQSISSVVLDAQGAGLVPLAEYRSLRFYCKAENLFDRTDYEGGICLTWVNCHGRAIVRILSGLSKQK